MGFFKKVGKVTGFMFNFRFANWVNYDYLKGMTLYLYKTYTDLFQIPPITDTSETFDEAKARLAWTQDLLESQSRHFFVMFFLFLFAALCLICYACYIFIEFHNLMGTIMSCGIACFALSQAFRYHFWRYQIKRQKLDCSIGEWMQDTFYKGFFK